MCRFCGFNNNNNNNDCCASDNTCHDFFDNNARSEFVGKQNS